MNYVQMIKFFLSSNELCSNIIGILSIPIEATLIMLLFTTLLSISATQNQKLLYISLLTLISIITNFIPYPYGTLLNLIAIPLLVFTIFRVDLLKAIFSEVIPFGLTVILETLLSVIFPLIFHIPYQQAYTIPIFRILLTSVLFGLLYLSYRLVKRFGWKITLIKNPNKQEKCTLIICLILGMVAIGIQLYLTIFYSTTLPTSITALSLVTIISYFIITIDGLIKSKKLQDANQDIETLQLYNKTLSIMYDTSAAFKHDFNNIVQSIKGYIQADDMNGLQNYFKQFEKDCTRADNLISLNPTVINNPSIYSILASKCHRADEKGIHVDIEITNNLNKLPIKIYELTRILGILLDNSIEAAQECEDKLITIHFVEEANPKRSLIIIQNTYSQKDIDTIKIFEKSYSTKKGNSGIGLWEVNQILKRNTNLSLFTTKDSLFFTQQLEMYEH